MTLESQTVILALLGALMTAVTNVFLARAMTHVGSFAAAQATNMGNVLILGVCGLWLFERPPFLWEAFAWFALVGVLNFSINRWVYYTGIRLMGPSRHVTIAGMSPLPSLLIATAFLGERPGPLVLMGTVLIVAGVVAVSYEPGGGGWFRAGFSWSLTSMILLATNGYFRKRGMDVMPAAALLTAWGALVALPTGETIRRFIPAHFFAWGRASTLPFLLLAVLGNSANQLILNNALRGKLSLAAPLMNAGPIFSLVLGALFLRDIERFTPRVVAGIFIAVAGMATVGLGRYN